MFVGTHALLAQLHLYRHKHCLHRYWFTFKYAKQKFEKRFTMVNLRLMVAYILQNGDNPSQIGTNPTLQEP